MATKKSVKAVTRTWKTFVENRNQLDNKLNALSAEGWTVFSIIPSPNVMGSNDIVAYKDGQ